MAALLAGEIAPPENLVAQGIPPLPDAIAAAAQPYSDSRSAALLSWHPRRREMLVSTRFAETAQVHRLAAPGGARTQLTFFPDRVAAALYPPDPARAAEYFVFSKDTGGGEFFQIYRYDQRGNGGKVTLLTDGKSRNLMGPFSRAGDRLAYTSTRRNNKDTDLYVIDPRDPASDRRLAEVEGGGWSPLDWSPDGKRLLVSQYISVNESYLWIFDGTTGDRALLTAKAGGEPVRYEGGQFSSDGKSIYAATDKDSEFLHVVVIDIANQKHRPLMAGSHVRWDVDTFAVSRDGRTVAVVINEEGIGTLRLFDSRTGRERAAPRLPAAVAGGSVTGILWHENSRELGVQVVTARSPTDVFSLDTRTGKFDRWTESETGGLDTTSTREPELVRWKSFDGRSISGFLYLPPRRFEGRRPVVINIHGGPEGQFRPTFLGRNRTYLEELGVALLFPNVRGSTGYGKSFTKLDNALLREDSVNDIGALLDWLPTRADLDAGRVMVTGGSYGGYMTLASAFHFADKIRCALSVVGISSFISFLERTEAYRRDLRRVEYGDERDPEMRAFFQRISPLSNADKIRKPMFIVQGKNDPRVPVTEADQIVATLKKQHTPIWYLMAQDEGHGFAKKKNADFQLYATVAFMQTFLLR
ncbi:MAG TPA: prolyl oligopeptidase family serine peptidase [Polyangia bacterium]|nr:prolyl oligopeptidase family serine peptidase [Polyangia bacterium]